MSFARSISKPCGLMTFWPRSVPTWKPTAGGSRPTVRTPGLSVGGAAAGPAAATVAVARATAGAAISRTFTCPSLDGPMTSSECSAWCFSGRGRTGERLGDLALEMHDQLLRFGHQPSVLDRSRRDPAVDDLDERPVLGADLGVEGDELLDPRLLGIGREEVVEEAGAPRRCDRIDRPDRQVRTSREDVDREVRPDEVELPALDLAGRVVAVRPVLPQRAQLGRDRAAR